MSNKTEKRGRGRPRFKPTQEQRGTVIALTGAGLALEEVAANIVNPATGKPISHVTLRNRFRHELREGKAKYKAFFVLKHAQLARSRDERIALRAVETGLKCHAGWVERTAHELSGPDGLPLGEPKPLNFVSVTDALFQAIRNDPVVQDRVRWNLLRLLMPGATDAELWSTWKVLCRRREEIEAVRAHAGLLGPAGPTSPPSDAALAVFCVGRASA